MYGSYTRHQMEMARESRRTSSQALAQAQWVEDFKSALSKVAPHLALSLTWHAVHNYRLSGYTPAEAVERYVDAKKISPTL